MQQPISVPPLSVITKEASKCKQCGLDIAGRFVRALNGHYHLDCFRCKDCNEVVAEKFFPLKDAQGVDQFYCEKDYFKKLDLLCSKCGGALRGPHITAMAKKYHLDHFTCSVCPVVFRQHDQYFERDGNVYCQTHYSILFANNCGGCETAVLRNFVEMNKEGVIEQWHPECYMVYKLWGCRVASSKHPLDPKAVDAEAEVDRQKNTVEKVNKILKVLSAFEHSSAECIQDLLVHFASQQYEAGVVQAEKFICHIEAVFASLDQVEISLSQFNDKTGIVGTKEPKALAKKIVSFFTLLSNETDAQNNMESTTRLIDVVSPLARQLKALIRSTLKGSLKLERTYSQTDSIENFLARLIAPGDNRDIQGIRKSFHIDINTDICFACKKAIEDSNYRLSEGYHWHTDCFKCGICGVKASNDFMDFGFDLDGLSLFCGDHKENGTNNVSNFQSVTLLQQYVFLLRCALKRLCVQRKINVDSFLISAKSLEAIDKSIPDSNNASPPTIPASPINKPSQPQNINVNNNNNTSSTSLKPMGVFGSIPTNQLSKSPNLASSDIDYSSPHGSPLAQMNNSTTLNRMSLFLGDLSPLQHMVVRQMAALKIQPILEKWFSFDEVMELAEVRKRTVWSKMVGAFKPPKKNGKVKEGTFGVPLDLLLEKCGVDTDLKHPSTSSVKVPIFIDACIKAMNGMDLSVEGIFRKNGNIRKLKTVAENLDRDPRAVGELKDDNPIQLAALIKKFLRDLPEPLLTFKLFKLFISTQRLPDELARKEALHYVCCLLPKPNLDFLEVLLWFLRQVSKLAGDKTDTIIPNNEETIESDEQADGDADNEQQIGGGNKMDMENLAVVIAPNILYSKSKNPINDETVHCNSVVLMLMKYQDEFWTVPKDIKVIEDFRGVDLNNIEPDQEKEYMKKFDDIVVSMKNQSIAQDVKSFDGEINRHGSQAKVEDY